MSHYVYIKGFNRSMCNKTKYRTKQYFFKCCLQCFSSERVLIEHKETYLKINGKQNVKLKSRLIKFKNHFKQLIVLFRIYADFECNAKGVKNNDKNVKIIFLGVLLMKLYTFMINLANQLFLTKEKMQSINLLKQFLKSMIISKKQ